MPDWLTSALDLVGIVLVVVGVALWWPPAAFMAAGVLVVAFSTRSAREAIRPRREPRS